MKCRSRASRISGTVIPPAPPGVEGWTLLRPQNWGQTAAAHRSRRLRLPPGGVSYPAPRSLPLLARDCEISYPSPRLSRLPFENGCSPLYERKVTELPFRRGGGSGGRRLPPPPGEVPYPLHRVPYPIHLLSL